ncbi:nitrogen fixation protein NifH [Chloroflexota bacterium]
MSGASNSINDWKSVLKADPTDWLLERNNPSVRYFTLTSILDIPPDRSKVIDSYREIMETGVVPRILSKQEEGGYWGISKDFYMRAKYKGTVWQLIILAELGASSSDKRIQKACEFIFENSQDRSSGSFAMQGTPKNGGNHSAVIPCLTGNMVYSLIKLGYLEDPRLQKGIEWIAAYQRFDDQTDKIPRGWPYDMANACWGRHTCSMGAIKALNALSAIPEHMRSPEVKHTIAEGAEYFLKHHVHKRSHSLGKICKPSWLKFGFPLMYQTDALEILSILTELGYRDERMQEAIDLVLSKQDDQGRWILESTFNGRFHVNIEVKGKPSKWVTLKALRMLKTQISDNIGTK